MVETVSLIPSTGNKLHLPALINSLSGLLNQHCCIKTVDLVFIGDFAVQSLKKTKNLHNSQLT